MSGFRRPKNDAQIKRRKMMEVSPYAKELNKGDPHHIDGMIHRKHKKFLDPAKADDLERRWRIGGARGGRKKNKKPISLAGPKFEQPFKEEPDDPRS